MAHRSACLVEEFILRQKLFVTDLLAPSSPLDGENRHELKYGYLKRDPRAKERRKFGLKKARKAPQWRTKQKIKTNICRTDFFA